MKVALHENEKWTAYVIPIDFMWNNQKGRGSAVFWYSANEKTFETHETLKKETHRNVVEPVKKSEQKFLLPFNDKQAQILAISGGKGSSIAVLKEIQEKRETASEFTVPDGFVVAVKAYNVHLQKNMQIMELIKILENVAYKRIDGNLEDSCHRYLNRLSSLSNEIKII